MTAAGVEGHVGDPDGAAASPRRGRGDRTRAALVDAAVELFGRKGMDGTSVDEVTAAADVAKGTFYVHFARKQDVLLEHGAQIVESLDVGDLEGPVADDLHTTADRLAAALAGTPQPVLARMVRELMGSPQDWRRVIAGRRTLGAVLRPVVERGQAAGTLRTDLSAARLGHAVVVLWLDGVIGWAERGDARPLTRELGLATDLFLRGATVGGP